MTHKQIAMLYNNNKKRFLEAISLLKRRDFHDYSKVMKIILTYNNLSHRSKGQYGQKKADVSDYFLSSLSDFVLKVDKDNKR